MQKQNAQYRRSGRGQQQLVPFITRAGVSAGISIGNVPEDKWTPCHGETAKGITVKSLETQEFEGSTFLRQIGDKKVHSFKTAELEIAAFGILKGLGYKISAPVLGATM